MTNAIKRMVWYHTKTLTATIAKNKARCLICISH